MRPSKWNRDPESFMRKRSVGCSPGHVSTYDPDEQKIWKAVENTLKKKGAGAAVDHLKQIRLEQVLNRC